MPSMHQADAGLRMSPSFGLVTGSIVPDLEPSEKAGPELALLACTGQAVADKQPRSSCQPPAAVGGSCMGIQSFPCH